MTVMIITREELEEYLSEDSSCLQCPHGWEERRELRGVGGLEQTLHSQTRIPLGAGTIVMGPNLEYGPQGCNITPLRWSKSLDDDRTMASDQNREPIDGNGNAEIWQWTETTTDIVSPYMYATKYIKLESMILTLKLSKKLYYNQPTLLTQSYPPYHS
jgi:hypothetical protein